MIHNILQEPNTAASSNRYQELLKKQFDYYSDFQRRLDGCPDNQGYFRQLRERVDAHIGMLGSLLHSREAS